MTQQIGDTTQHFEPETVEGRICFNERIGESPKWSMKQIVAVPLIAITSLLGVQFVSATLGPDAATLCPDNAAMCVKRPTLGEMARVAHADTQVRAVPKYCS
jgi:hypothetical protein